MAGIKGKSGRQKGTPKTGGRQKGSLSKKQQRAKDILDSLGCDPIRGMATVAEENVPCMECRNPRTGKPTGVATYVPTAAGLKKCINKGAVEYICQRCFGSLKEPIEVELRAKMYESLAKYTHPQLKAVEHSGEGGGPAIHVTVASSLEEN